MTYERENANAFRRLREKLSLGCVGGSLIIVALLVLIGAMWLYHPVPYGNVDLVTEWSALSGEVWEEGLHWLTPIKYRTVRVNVQQQEYETLDEIGFANSQATYKDYPVSAQTIDGQQIQVKFTVRFRIDKDDALEITRNIGLIGRIVENVVKANARSLVRTTAQLHEAEELFSGSGIIDYQNEVRELLDFKFNEAGVTLVDFLVRKIDFDPDYVQAIEQQQIAQEQIETTEYRAEAAVFERNIQITLAEGEAERTRLLAIAEADNVRILAQAEADNIVILAEADANAIEARGSALERFPDILMLEFIQNLDESWGFLPTDSIEFLLPLPTE